MNTDHTDRLNYAISNINGHKLRIACLGLLKDEKFSSWPAATGFHHAYETGLIQHTLEVAEIALHIAAKFPGVNKDVLIAAALWHDYGKTFQYVVEYWGHDADRSKGHLVRNIAIDPAFAVDLYTEAVWIRDSKAVHHCISSAQEFIVAARANGVDRATEAAVVHCILSHHGPVKEWGSPVAPESIEAIILHQADYLSAKAGATK